MKANLRPVQMRQLWPFLVDDSDSSSLELPQKSRWVVAWRSWKKVANVHSHMWPCFHYSHRSRAVRMAFITKHQGRGCFPSDTENIWRVPGVGCLWYISVSGHHRSLELGSSVPSELRQTKSMIYLPPVRTSSGSILARFPHHPHKNMVIPFRCTSSCGDVFSLPISVHFF